jgi:hypothetical protein
MKIFKYFFVKFCPSRISHIATFYSRKFMDSTNFRRRFSVISFLMFLQAQNVFLMQNSSTFYHLKTVNFCLNIIYKCAIFVKKNLEKNQNHLLSLGIESVISCICLFESLWYNLYYCRRCKCIL